MTTKYYTTYDSYSKILHAYSDSGKDEILHINATHPLINLISRDNFERAIERDGGLTGIIAEEFITLRNEVLHRMDLI